MKKIIICVCVLLLSFVVFEEKSKADVSKNVSDFVVSETQYEHNIAGIHKVNELDVLIHSDRTYYLFLGFKECQYCRNFSDKLREFKKVAKYPIYYVDLKDSYLDTDRKILANINMFLINYIHFGGAPMFVRVVNGVVTERTKKNDITLNELYKMNY